jgi:hypothetical protein
VTARRTEPAEQQHLGAEASGRGIQRRQRDRENEEPQRDARRPPRDPTPSLERTRHEGIVLLASEPAPAPPRGGAARGIRRTLAHARGCVTREASDVAAAVGVAGAPVGIECELEAAGDGYRSAPTPRRLRIHRRWTATARDRVGTIGYAALMGSLGVLIAWSAYAGVEWSGPLTRGVGVAVGLAVLIGHAAEALALLLDRTTIELRERWIEVSYGPIPWVGRRARKLSAAADGGLRVAPGGRRRAWRVLLDDASSTVVLDDLGEPQARFVADVLSAELRRQGPPVRVASDHADELREEDDDDRGALRDPPPHVRRR